MMLLLTFFLYAPYYDYAIVLISYNHIMIMQLLHLDQEDGVDITANSLHPGCIYTNIVSPEVGKTIPKGR
jgi:hypothetical protein